MTLRDRMTDIKVTSSGKITDRDLVAKAISDEIDDDAEHVVYHNDAVDILCATAGVSGEANRQRLMSRYLSSDSNPYIKETYGIKRFSVREIVVELAKEGFFGDLDIKGGAQILIKSADEDIYNVTKITLMTKSKEDAKEHVKKGSGFLSLSILFFFQGIHTLTI